MSWNRTDSQSFHLKIGIIFLVMTGCFVFLSYFFWSIQVKSGGYYEASLTKQSMRRVREPGLRGTIYDRNGIRLADNEPSYALALYLEELRQPGSTQKTVNYVYSLIEEMSAYFGLPVTVSKADIKIHMQRRLPLPFIVQSVYVRREIRR